MHISLIATRKNADRSERELYEMDLVLRVLGLKRSFLDLGMVTVAGCTPRDVNLRFVDEYLEDIDYDAPTDLVALSAKTSCVPQAFAVADRFRAKGKKVVLGGIHASLRPKEALEHADCVVTGEADALWPQVVKDAQAGRLKARYDAEGFPPMAEVPIPRWDITSSNKYLFQQLQTTRGCPFQCHFCSVPDISGQAFRFKPVDLAVRELQAMPKSTNPLLKVRPLYVVDDNFISRLSYTKELLQAMVPLRQQGLIPPWSAETTVNVARDEELLDLFRDAGCGTLIVGFESVSEATLNHMNKGVNFSLTYQDAVDRIHARGMSIVGNFIVGFDTDHLDVFRATLDFIQKTGILYPFFSILTPMPGTKLHEEVKAEGRLDHFDWGQYDTRHVVFQPKNMTREQLQDGYNYLYEQAYSTDLLLDRIERQWKLPTTIPRRKAGMLERTFLRTRLASEWMRGDAPMRRLYHDAFALLANPHLSGDPGQLLILLDSDHFARFMRRYRSPDYARNVRTFETWAHGAAEAGMQWQNEKAVRLSGKRKMPVMAG